MRRRAFAIGFGSLIDVSGTATRRALQTLRGERPFRDPVRPDHEGRCRFVPNWGGGRSCMYGCGRWAPW